MKETAHFSTLCPLAEGKAIVTWPLSPDHIFALQPILINTPTPAPQAPT